MPRKRKAAPEANREAAEQTNQRTAILADDDANSKQASSLGRCVCHVPIGSNLHTLGCKTCGAWARWRSAFRVAASAIKGPQ